MFENAKVIKSAQDKCESKDKTPKHRLKLCYRALSSGASTVSSRVNKKQPKPNCTRRSDLVQMYFQLL